MYSINIHLPYPPPLSPAPSIAAPVPSPAIIQRNTLHPSTNTIQASDNTFQTRLEHPTQSQKENKPVKARSSTPMPYVRPTRSTLKPKLRSGERFMKPKKPYEEWRIEDLHRELKKAQERVAALQQTLVEVALQYTEGRFDSETEPESEEEEKARGDAKMMNIVVESKDSTAGIFEDDTSSNSSQVVDEGAGWTLPECEQSY
ncbi:hypothetical protein M422DRAFT_43626 [Sphaerobolus stellatus SS14]|nr:hypothetical protein M422DRAFT_43626 [Sphaerobolus stellatus SS14]